MELAMELVFYAAIALGVLLIVTNNIRAGMFLLGFAWFGPVGWKYLQTSDGSLIYEAFFRAVLISAIVYAVNTVTNHKSER